MSFDLLISLVVVTLASIYVVMQEINNWEDDDEPSDDELGEM